MKNHWHRRYPKRHKRPQISILVPFRNDSEHRNRVWSWLKKFWEYHLGYEIIIGKDDSVPFSKAAAVNDAASRAKGRIFVIIDADCYIDPDIIQDCADAIDEAVEDGRRLWLIPYLHLYRLTREATLELIEKNPEDEYDVSSPPPESWIEPNNSSHYGHQYGAMLMIMPSDAFWLAGGMDPRFNKGWGGEDASFMRAVDAMYALHETRDNDILHLWHTRPGKDYLTRHWVGQRMMNANSRLAQRYGLASGDSTFMKALIDERSNPTIT